MTHRIGALVVLAVIGTLGFRLLGQAAPVLRGLGGLLLVLLAVQIALGTANVLMSLPLPVAVAHNGVAALLMLTLVTLLHRVNVRAPEVSNPSSSVEVPANDREGLGSWT
jgi:cytochrome c oxidase assembly protein subunit 15